jgi:hypothetical protein
MQPIATKRFFGGRSIKFFTGGGLYLAQRTGLGEGGILDVQNYNSRLIFD